MNPQMMIFATLVVGMLALPGTLGSDSSNEWQASYVGGSAAAPPPSVTMPPCATEGLATVGGVLFCGFPKTMPSGSRSILMVIEDDVNRVAGTFTCLESVGPDTYRAIATGSNSIDIGSVQRCATHPDDAPDTTRLAIFPDAAGSLFYGPATTGTVLVKHV